MAARLPMVTTDACEAVRHLPGTDRTVRCTRRHLDRPRETWHVTTLYDQYGPVNVGWGMQAASPLYTQLHEPGDLITSDAMDLADAVRAALEPPDTLGLVQGVLDTLTKYRDGRALAAVINRLGVIAREGGER